MAISQETISIRDTDPHKIVVERTFVTERILFRFINGLDSNVTIVVEATDNYDTDFSESEVLDPKKVVQATDVGSAYLTEPWEKIQFTVTATSIPTTGEFELRTIKEPMVYR